MHKFISLQLIVWWNDCILEILLVLNQMEIHVASPWNIILENFKCDFKTASQRSDCTYLATRSKRCKLVFYRRQKELEAKNIEEEANKRIEELVAKRVEEELERRRDEIEAEVMRRVEEAKKIMEAKMMEEMERRKKEQQEEIDRREVRILLLLLQIRIPNTDSGVRSDRHPQKLILEDDCFFLEWNTKTKSIYIEFYAK